MDIQPLELKGAALITTKRFADSRGFFTERFRQDKWLEFNPKHGGFIQDNYSWSNANVLRGLHYQFNPDQGKLVTCVQGRVVDVLVDIRPNSPSLGKHLKIELKAEEPQWVWIPPGFAHGFVVTSPEGAGLLYRVDQPYSPKTEGAIRWDDPDLKIEWPTKSPVLSDKDLQAQTFEAYLKLADHSVGK